MSEPKEEDRGSWLLNPVPAAEVEFLSSAEHKPMTIKQLRIIKNLVHSQTSRFRLKQVLARCIQEIEYLSRELETAN